MQTAPLDWKARAIELWRCGNTVRAIAGVVHKREGAVGKVIADAIPLAERNARRGNKNGLPRGDVSKAAIKHMRRLNSVEVPPWVPDDLEGEFRELTCSADEFHAASVVRGLLRDMRLCERLGL